MAVVWIAGPASTRRLLLRSVPTARPASSLVLWVPVPSTPAPTVAPASTLLQWVPLPSAPAPTVTLEDIAQALGNRHAPVAWLENTVQALGNRNAHRAQ